MDHAAWDAETLTELPQRQRCEGRWADLEATLFGDPAFLEAKVAAGMLAELIEDYRATADDERAEPSLRRSAMLVEEALRRDRRFIENHRKESSHVLFQCVWNAFVEARRGGGVAMTDAVPCSQDSREGDPLARIERLLSAWRVAKERATPAFPWVRSLLPPATPIGSGMIDVVRGHGNAVGPVAWSADGERILCVVDVRGGHDLVQRDARTLEKLARHEHFADAAGLAVCPTTGRVVVACASGPFLFVDGGSASVRRLEVPYGLGRVKGASFSPDGSVLAAAADAGVQLWRAGSGEKGPEFIPSAVFRGDLGLDAGAPVFTAGGEAVVVPVSLRSTWQLLLLDSVRCEPVSSYDLDAHVRQVAVLPDGDRVVCALKNHSLRVFSLSRRGWVARLGAHRDWVRGLVVSRDGKRIASASSDGTARVWDADTGREVACLEGHEGAVFGIAFSPSGKYLATGGMDKSLRIWQLSRVWLSRATSRGEDRWRAAKSSRDGRWVAAVTESGGLRLFGPEEGHGPVDVPEAGRKVSCLAFAHDGESLLFADGGTGPRVLDLGSRAVGRHGAIHAEKITSIEVSRNSALTAVGTEQGGVQLWRAAEAGRSTCLQGTYGAVGGIAFSADGRRVLAWGVHGASVWDREPGGKPVRIWSEDDYADRCEEVYDRSPPNDMLCADIAPDGSSVVTGTYQDKLERWDARTGKSLPSFFAPGEAMVIRNPATGEVVGEIGARDRLLTYRPFAWLGGGIQGVAFSADGTRLATFARGITRLWDAATREMLRDLDGRCDLRDLVSPSSDPVAIDDGHEIAFLSRATWKADAWFPDSFLPVAAGPGRWNAAEHHARWLRLEGRRGD